MWFDLAENIYREYLEAGNFDSTYILYSAYRVARNSANN